MRLDAAKAAAQAGPLTFTEYGKCCPVDPLRFGDIVLARKDVPAAYHLAVVVDDAFQGVSLVTRGEDLLPATHVQRLLQALLALPEPALCPSPPDPGCEQGRKFSKRDQAVTLKALRQSGRDTPGRYTHPAWALRRAYAKEAPMSDHPIDRLFATIAARKAAGDTSSSYTAKLLSEGVAKCAKKFGEEAVETVLAGVSGDKAASRRRIRRCAVSPAGAVGGGGHHAG